MEKQTEAGGTKPRYDTAVIELNLSSSERRFIPKIIKGVEADSPVPPTLTRTANIYQLGLANIYRAANSTALGTITDTRSDSQRCGISKVAVPNVPDDVINLWASQYPGVVSLADILTKISTEGLPIPFGGTGKTTAAAALKALGGASIKRVYRNASPDSAFPAQTVSNNMGGYPKYFVLFGYGSSPCALAIVEKNKKTLCYGIVSAAAQRTITINENNFAVSIGEIISSGWKTNNNAMVPLEIYGMEGVL